MLQPDEVPQMPASYALDADLLAETIPDLTIAEAYWIAACQALGVRVPTEPKSVRVVGTMGGARVEWTEQGRRRQRSFEDPLEAKDWSNYLRSEGYRQRRSR